MSVLHLRKKILAGEKVTIIDLLNVEDVLVAGYFRRWENGQFDNFEAMLINLVGDLIVNRHQLMAEYLKQEMQSTAPIFVKNDK